MPVVRDLVVTVPLRAEPRRQGTLRGCSQGWTVDGVHVLHCLVDTPAARAAAAGELATVDSLLHHTIISIIQHNQTHQSLHR